MAVSDLGKVAMTFGGNYNSSTIYEKLTVVIPSDGNSYVSLVDNVVGVEPGVTNGWQTYWQILSMRGVQGNGITRIEKTGVNGTVDTYTIYYDDGTTWTYNVSNGEGIQSIVKTSTSGSVDTYTITFGNNQTQTFTVTNARELASGGTKNQVLRKRTNTDYDVEWSDVAITGEVTLSANGWTNNSQTVSAPGVTSDNVVIISPVYASQWEYNLSGVGASSQGSGTLTFNARKTPTSSLTVNYMVIN